MLKTLLTLLFPVLDKVVDNVAERDKLKAELTSQAISAEAELYKAQGKIITQEAKGSWMQRSWRPLGMFMFLFIILNNYVLVPWMNGLLGLGIPVLDLPPGAWALITAGFSGYVVGRSGEKIVKTWKGGSPLEEHFNVTS